MNLSSGCRVAAIAVICGLSACSDDSAPMAAPEEAALLRIAVAPVERASWSPIFMLEGEGADVRLSSSTPLTLALGEDYPSTFAVDLGGAWITVCGSIDVRFELESLVAPSGVEMALAEAPGFTVAIADAQDGEATLSGVLHFDDPSTCTALGGATELPFELTVPLRVRRPAGASIRTPERCVDAGTLRMQSGARFAQYYAGLGASPIDDAGEVFYPDNASDDRSVEVFVRADAGTSLGLDNADVGLASLFAVGSDTDVTIVWREQALLELELVEAGAIDAMDLDFGLLGYGGGGTSLESGQTYGELGFARTSSSIGVVATSLSVDGEPLCTMPRAEDFELVTHTPEVCAAHDDLGHGDYLIGGAPIPVSADLVQSGACSLEVRAPELDEADGLVTALDVVVHNAESLIGIGERG